MDKTVYKYLIRYSLPQQIWLTALAASSFPFLYAFYELPKRIINGAIQGDPEGFPVDLFGARFDQTGYLFLLCTAFLILVLINQAFKYYINVYQGLTGERMLRRLRYQLFSRVLRFPQPTFKNMSQGEIIPMVTAEVEPLGGFIGEAFALPAFQQLLISRGRKGVDMGLPLISQAGGGGRRRDGAACARNRPWRFDPDPVLVQQSCRSAAEPGPGSDLADRLCLGHAGPARPGTDDRDRRR